MPDEPNTLTDRLKSLSNEQQLLTINQFRENPWFGEMVAFFRDNEEQCITAVIDTVFAGYHDILNQQQVIGETRGLRRFVLEIEDRITKLQALIESKQDEPATGNTTDGDGNASKPDASSVGNASTREPDPLESPFSI